MNAIFEPVLESSPVDELISLLGDDAVLLEIPWGEKAPRNSGWQNTLKPDYSDSAYKERLKYKNIGVLLGKPSGGLCTIDIDSDDAVEAFQKINPLLQASLRTKGSRGVQIWIKINGEYPKLTKLKTNKGDDWGEWRSDGGQSIIHGRHPKGMDYQRVVEVPPVSISFDQICWPDELMLPWQSKERNYAEFDELVDNVGLPFTSISKNSVTLNQGFFAEKYALENAVLFEPKEKQFYEYQSETGLWKPVTQDALKRKVAKDYNKAVKEFGDKRLSGRNTNGWLTDVVGLLRGHVEKDNAFSKKNQAIHLVNGMLRLDCDPPKLYSFDPNYYSRNVCPISFDAEAECPLFLDTLLGGALDDDDISLVQRWMGSCLLGNNPAQRFLLLLGTPGGGKSTLIEVVESMIGLDNVTQLRTHLLSERFELSRFEGKTLLTGKDVKSTFLNQPGAETIKSLVGHDLLTVERKNANGGKQIRGDYNIAITCNSHLRVRLDGDKEAWKRRLLIINYQRSHPETRIANLASRLINDEGSGILNFMIEGAILHLNEIKLHGDYVLTEVQQKRIDNMLDESDSVRTFVKDCVVVDKDADVTSNELIAAYQNTCIERGWIGVNAPEFHTCMPLLMSEIHKAHKRHDIHRMGSSQRGYAGFDIMKGGE